MPIRSLFLTLTRNLRSSHTPFLTSSKTLSRSFSSGALNLNPIEESQPLGAPAEDDLKSRILRLRFPKRSATTQLQRWVSEGKDATLPELRQIAKELRRLQRYKHALEVSEWMVTHQEFEVSGHDHAVRIDLITKVFGTNAAEEHFEGLPSTAKTNETYTALLHSYASAKQTEKAEALFERIKESGLTLSVLACNEMMTLYMSTGQLDKVSLVMEELKRQRVSPDLFTYNLWISSCAATLDIDGITRILEEMSRDSNSNESWKTYMTLTNIYITAGRLVDSKNAPVEADKKITQREWITYDFLIILYTGLGNKERILEIWKSLRMTSQKMTSRNYLCILSSHVMLEQLKEAEEVIDQWKQCDPDFDVTACKRLFDAFLDAGSVEKAESLRQLLLQKDCNLVDWTL
ncbi:pentatricopeptide repeat-containing protein At5g09450, mitochondrial [Magnolia sinica]|uniref:pentatricopeptide repeat-containing protein At5g09450, mitochondrial n=1 Tax=Magnolia sinica TaxID=86752 RepID=UPI0026589087|nr:pentatricopeptide repeat-containing protein At5g09450, mitochondrial [Magnolia sinica]XP_058087815.1 pentatricopeptide repeat-containing protein At5g09450, mitochondrial [Magnolia sinica]